MAIDWKALGSDLLAGRVTATEAQRRLALTATRAGAPADLVAGVSDAPREDLAEWGHTSEFRTAPHRGDLELLAAVRRQAIGSRCTTCEGRGSVRRSVVDGVPVAGGFDRLVRCPGCRGSGFAIKPDARLALDLLGKRRPEFGQRAEVQHQHQHAGAVDVRIAAATLDLAAMTPEQLRALSGWAGDDGRALPEASTASNADAADGPVLLAVGDE